MIGIMRALWRTVGSRFKSRERLEAGNLALRHHVTVLRRSVPGRLRLRGSDRFLFVWLYRLWPSVLGSIVIVQPETVVRWHRDGFKVSVANSYYFYKSPAFHRLVNSGGNGTIWVHA